MITQSDKEQSDYSSLVHVTHTVICTGGLNWEGHKDHLGLKNVVLVLNMEVVL